MDPMVMDGMTVNPSSATLVTEEVVYGKDGSTTSVPLGVRMLRCSRISEICAGERGSICGARPTGALGSWPGAGGCCGADTGGGAGCGSGAVGGTGWGAGLDGGGACLGTGAG